MYLWACKYEKFPRGHLKKIYDRPECTDIQISTICGYINCKILPPRDLFPPVSPYKMTDKIMFMLGRTFDKNVCKE